MSVIHQCHQCHQCFLRMHKNWLCGKLSLHLGGCAESYLRLVCRSVGFWYKSVYSLPLGPIHTFVSRKFMDFLECSAVSFIVGWNMFMNCIHFLSSTSPWSYM